MRSRMRTSATMPSQPTNAPSAGPSRKSPTTVRPTSPAEAGRPSALAESMIVASTTIGSSTTSFVPVSRRSATRALAGIARERRALRSITGSVDASASVASAWRTGESSRMSATPSPAGPSTAPRARKTATRGAPLRSRAPETSDATTMTMPTSAIVVAKCSTAQTYVSDGLGGERRYFALARRGGPHNNAAFMPLDIWLDAEERLRHTVGHGTLTDRDLLEAWGDALADPAYDPSADNLVDMSSVERFEVTPIGAQRLADVMAMCAPTPKPGVRPRVALVAPTDDAFSVMRMYEM